MVHPGTYYEHDIDFLGKSITVMGTDPEDSAVVAATVVDGDSLSSVFIFRSGEDTTSLLAGLTITKGYASSAGGIYCYFSSPTISNNIIIGNSAFFSYPEGTGGGMYCYKSSPIVINCTFSGNSAYYGGGMFNYDSRPTVSNCIFSENSAYYGGGMNNHAKHYSTSSPTVTNCTFSGNVAASGGGMVNDYSNSTVTNCTFSGNVAASGGGMVNYYSSPTVTNCTFSDNSADYDGGGMYNTDYSSPTVTNCTFNGNQSEGRGGGMYNEWRSNPMVTNCTFSNNSAGTDGGGMYNSGSIDPTVTNCILWGDSPDEIYNSSNPAIVTYSNVEGGYTGEGNIDEDPRFITFRGFEFLLHPDSPCIDTGDPSIEDGISDWHPKWPEKHIDGPRSDMGAYGGQGNMEWLQ
jgi:parallel beta-helix repeat protein/predicted outer membrane repeat protein